MTNQNGSEPKYLTVTQVAESLYVHRHSVLNWIAKGKLEAIRTPGGHYRIKESSIEKMLDDAKKS